MVPSLEFDYTNWRRKDHHYLVHVEKFECGSYDPDGTHEGPPYHWVLHAQVLTRDGQPRVGRRTFILTGIRNMKEVHDGTSNPTQPAA